MIHIHNQTIRSSAGTSNHGSEPSSRAILRTDAGTTVNTRQTRDVMQEVQEEIEELLPQTTPLLEGTNI